MQLSGQSDTLCWLLVSLEHGAGEAGGRGGAQVGAVLRVGEVVHFGAEDGHYGLRLGQLEAAARPQAGALGVGFAELAFGG